MITQETEQAVSPTAKRVAVAALTTSADVDLALKGMTCASCVARIERTLSKVPGVDTVSVNLATEKAHVRYDPTTVATPQLVGAVEAAGYKARGRAADRCRCRGDATGPDRDRHDVRLVRRAD